MGFGVGVVDAEADDAVPGEGDGVGHALGERVARLGRLFDVYHPFETFVPFRWDATDLNDVLDEWLGNPAGEAIKAHAADLWRQSHRDRYLRAEQVLAEVGLAP